MTEREAEAWILLAVLTQPKPTAAERKRLTARVMQRLEEQGHFRNRSSHPSSTEAP